MSKSIRVLIVEDSEDDAQLNLRAVGKAGYETTHTRVDTPSAMEAALDAQEWDIVLSDYTMPRFDALEALKILQKRKCEIPFIIVSGSIGEETAVAAMKAGAHDYVMKDRIGRLVPAVERELREAGRRKEHAEATKKLAEQAALLDITPNAVAILDKEGRISFWNRGAERMFGWPSEEAMGKCYPDLVCEGTDPGLEEILHAVKEKGIWSGECRQVTRDGRKLITASTWSTMQRGKGHPSSTFVVNMDITEKKNLEIQNFHAQRMESVGTLAGGIAHDFNNVLTGILGFSEILRTRIAGDPQAVSDLDQIVTCGERASTLTRQLLAFARRQITNPINVDLNMVVAELLKLIRNVIGAHIEVKTSLGRDLAVIFADRGQLEQILMNLCLNARDAMPEGGELLIETATAVLDHDLVKDYPYLKTGRYAALTVSDTGVGMDETTRERAFEPFFTTKGPEKGTGLGLAMVYGIVKQHNGFIQLESKPGKGTTFRIYFPKIHAPPDVEVSRRPDPVRGGSETILLAEDDEFVRALAERTLREFGYTVLAARNGEEAVELFRLSRDAVALAVLDVVMPRKGGKEAYEEMQKSNPDLKVLFMSGYSAAGIHDSFVLTPGLSFLPKPIVPGSLARKVRETLDRDHGGNP